MSQQLAIPTLTYWECLWNSMFAGGWDLSHYARSDEYTGALRHVVRACKQGNELECVAPTMTQAVQLLYAESKSLPVHQ